MEISAAFLPGLSKSQIPKGAYEVRKMKCLCEVRCIVSAVTAGLKQTACRDTWGSS